MRLNIPGMETKEHDSPSTYGELERQCVELGITIYALCKEAGVEQSALTHWKAKEPKTLVTLTKLNEAMERLKTKKTA